MKNLLLILLLTISITSCNPRKINPDDKKYFQEIFRIKGDVKEIQEKIVTKDFYYHSVTTFDRDGNPTETIKYKKDGTVESREPWKKLTEEEELKQTKLKNEYDSKHKLIRQIQYSNKVIDFQTEYKYNELGKKVEEIRKFGNRKVQSLYHLNGLLKEVITSILEDDQFYWQSKEKYIYNENHYLIEKQLYGYSDENHFYSKDLYEYDNIGSLIKTTTRYADNKIPEVKNRKIIYY